MVYVDALRRHPFGAYTSAQALRVGQRYGHRWCHLYADSEFELRTFAAAIGMKAAWAHRSSTGLLHYDLTPPRRRLAVEYGAVELTARQALELRRRLHIEERKVP